MSFITQRCSDLEQYITNKLVQGDTVYVYSRPISLAVGLFVTEYIATTEDSYTPPNATLDRIETPTRSIVYAGVKIVNNAPNMGIQGVFSGPTVLCPEDC